MILWGIRDHILPIMLLWETLNVNFCFVVEKSNFKVEINPQRVSVVVTKADKIKEETLVWIIKQCWSEGSQRVWRSLKVGVANKQVVVWTSRPLCFIIQWKVWTLAIPFSDFSGLIILFLKTPLLIRADACRACTCAVCWPQTFSCPSVILLRKKLKLTFQKIWTKDPQWVFKTWQLSKTPHCAPIKLCQRFPKHKVVSVLTTVALMKHTAVSSLN